MPFHNGCTVKAGDNLSTVAQNHGFQNPGLYGSDATVYKRAQQVKQQAEQDVQRLSQRINEARQQLAMPFYNARI